MGCSNAEIRTYVTLKYDKTVYVIKKTEWNGNVSLGFLACIVDVILLRVLNGRE